MILQQMSHGSIRNGSSTICTISGIICVSVLTDLAQVMEFLVLVDVVVLMVENEVWHSGLSTQVVVVGRHGLAQASPSLPSP